MLFSREDEEAGDTGNTLRLIYQHHNTQPAALTLGQYEAIQDV